MLRDPKGALEPGVAAAIRLGAHDHRQEPAGQSQHLVDEDGDDTGGHGLRHGQEIMPRPLEDLFHNKYFILLIDLLLVYIFWKLFTRFTRKALEKSKRDNVLIGFVVSAETVLAVFLAIMLAVSVALDTKIVRILGAAGAGVAVLAIILKDAAANVMGGISVLASKKVNLGDRISVANGQVGYVTVWGMLLASAAVLI